MSVITISRGAYSHGKDIAEKVAHKLGYECISRDILIEASKEFNVPEIKLFQAIHDSSNIMGRIFGKKERYITYIQTALLKSLKKDHVVYHGYAGHFFVKDVSHAFKVRIVADMEERIRIMRERNGVSRKEAVQFIQKLDKQRKQWSYQLYGIDTSDPSLYDLVIHIQKISVDAAVDIICYGVGLKRFQTTPESQQKINDLSLAAEAKAVLMELKPDIEVKAKDGLVLVTTNASAARKLSLEPEMRAAARKIPHLTELKLDAAAVPAPMRDYTHCEILVVDDEPVVCDRLKAFLEKDGHRVETFVDPRSALQRLETKEFDIVISDIRMGEINGIQVMQTVFQKSRHTRVIMITGYATLELAKETLTMGAFEFIEKPFKSKDIRGTIARATASLRKDSGQAADTAAG